MVAMRPTVFPRTRHERREQQREVPELEIREEVQSSRFHEGDSTSPNAEPREVLGRMVLERGSTPLSPFLKVSDRCGKPFKFAASQIIVYRCPIRGNVSFEEARFDDSVVEVVTAELYNH